MLIKLMLLLMLTIAWLGTLWFGISPSLGRWSPAALITLHALPPLLLWGCGVWLHRYFLQRRAQAAIEQRAQSVAIQQAQLDATRKQHLDALAQRRLFCDCRWISLEAEPSRVGALPKMDLHNVRLAVRLQDPASNTDDDDPQALDFSRFAPPLYNALQRLYDQSPAAVVLPIYVCASRALSGEAVLAGIRTLYRQVGADMEPQPKLLENAVIRFLNSAERIAEQLLASFEADPELPGVVILAFDAPLVAQDAPPSGQAVVAMLLTAHDLAQTLAGLPSQQEAPMLDLMSPHWERELDIGHNNRYLAQATPVAWRSLLELPVLGQLRRPAGVEDRADAPPPRTAVLQSLLERAGVNAGLLPCPFPGDQEPESSDQLSIHSCGWLVHNAGEMGRAGARLAELSRAMSYHGITTEPIDEATNLAATLGDLGEANPAAALALALLQSAVLAKPVLLAEYVTAKAVSLSFITPTAACEADPIESKRRKTDPISVTL